MPFTHVCSSFEVCTLRWGVPQPPNRRGVYEHFIFCGITETFIVKRHVTWQMCVCVYGNAVSSVVIGSCNVICCIFLSASSLLLLLLTLYNIVIVIGCICSSIFFARESWWIPKYKMNHSVSASTHTLTLTHGIASIMELARMFELLFIDFYVYTCARHWHTD